MIVVSIPISKKCTVNSINAPPFPWDQKKRAITKGVHLQLEVIYTWEGMHL